MSPTSTPPGPSGGLAPLLERHVRALRGYVRGRTGRDLRAREPCSDIVQSVVREVCQSARDREFPDDDSFRRFLLAVAANKIVSKSRYHRAGLRAAEREESRPLAESEVSRRAADLPSHSPSRAAERNEELERLRRALEELEDEDRELVILRRVLDVPPDEVARRLGIAESTVRWRLAGILADLARRLR